MAVAIEDSIYDFLAERIAAASNGNALSGIELLDSPFATITAERGIQIDDGDSEFAPSPGAEEIREFDGNVRLIIYRRLEPAERSERKLARSEAIALAMAVAKEFLDDQTMNNRVNDSRILRCTRGWANIKTASYCIMNVPLIVNETGSR